MLTISNLKYPTVPPVDLLWHPRVPWCTVLELWFSTDIYFFHFYILYCKLLLIFSYYHYRYFLILLFVHLERTRLGQAVYAQFSAGDRQGGPASSSIHGVRCRCCGLLSFLCAPKPKSAKAFSKYLQTRRGRDDVPGQEIVQSPRSPHRAWAILLSCTTEGAEAPGLKHSKWGGPPVPGERRRFDSVSKEEPLEDFTRGSLAFGVGTPFFFFFLINRLYLLE